MEHPANSLRDLDFVVPGDMTGPADIKLAFVYSDDIKDGGKIVDHLNGRVCPAYRDMGLIHPYNAGMSREYRAQVMALFKAGVIRVLVCTDAAGMGCDIPNIEIVIQWKLPKDLSSWIQRAGRAARAAGTYGVAIMIVEKSSFEHLPLVVEEAGGEGDEAEAVEAVWGEGGAKQGKDHAASHGQQRGWHRGGASDEITPLQELDVPQDAPLEGIYALIQATTCRRVILARIFENKRPGVFLQSGFLQKWAYTILAKGIRKGPPSDSVRQALFTWRRNILKMHYPGRPLAAHAILDDNTCELLASIGPVDSVEPLQQLLESSWGLWSRFGNILYVYMHGLGISPLPKPAPRAKQSRPAPEVPPSPPPPPPTPHAAVQAPPTSKSSIPGTAKRPHSSHGTLDDPLAPPASRARTTTTTVETPLQTPLPRRPNPPRPMYKGAPAPPPRTMAPPFHYPVTTHPPPSTPHKNTAYTYPTTLLRSRARS
ncbi:hypothetical protein C8R43DRAFT_1135855 [Mycena crocata]|nr:hypothetical protein C8R43DRAFT_1135855 [Mycena crocata]